MNENIGRYWTRLVQYWNQLSKSQKVIYISTIVLVILAISIISYRFSRTEYALAYTDLARSDAAAITEYLNSANIPYQLSDDGRSLGVPRSQVADVKIAVESQGLNKTGNIGYGAFDSSSSFGITDREFDVKYVNAVQGELQQLINSNNAISDSKVLITMPEKSVFLAQAAQQDQATASVVVNVKPGYQLDAAKIDTMYHLVSRSVKSLPVENITISDQDGNLLEYSKGQLNAGTTASNVAKQHFEMNNQFRNSIQRDLQQMLGAILGKDKVIVSVFSTMNFDQKNSRQQMVTAPNEEEQRGLEISLQEIQKSYSSDSGNQPGGVPGTGPTDVPGYLGSSGPGNSNSEELQRTVNFEVNRITNEIVSTPYVVKDLTINVGVEPPDPQNPDSLTPETIQAVQRILVNFVRAALADNGQVLTDEELEKKVSVFNHTFARESVAGTASNSMLLYGALGGVALALLGLGGYWFFRRRKASEEQLEDEFLTEQPKVEFPTIDLETVTNENQVRKQLEQLARKKPEEFVNLLRTWLVEE